MNLLNKITIKSLLLNKKRSIVTIIGIILSVALITGVASLYNSFLTSEINYEIYEYGDFHVAYFDASSTDLNVFTSNRKIDTIYITKEIGYAYLEDGINEYKPYIYVLGMTSSSMDSLGIKLVEGRLPENDREIVIPEHLLSNGGVELNIGDTITLNVGTRTREGIVLNQFDSYEIDLEEEIIDTSLITFTIVGIIERPSYKIETYSAPGYTFITYLSENDIEGNVNVYAKYTDSGVKDYLSVTAGILEIDADAFTNYTTNNDISITEEEWNEWYEEVSEAKYEYTTNSYLIQLETDPLGFSSNSSSLFIVLVIVSLIIVFTSIFCIKNSFDISITEKVREYGMFKSIGATKKQIRKNVFFEATILGLIGIPLGILSGVVATFILIIVCNIFLDGVISEGFVLAFSVSLPAIIFSIVLGIITIYLSAFKSARVASHTTPIEQIRNSANLKINSKKLKSPKIIHKLFGIGGDISYKNLKRNKKKYRTTTISLTVSIIVFISLYSFMQVAFTSLDNELNLYDYNITLSISNGSKEVYEKVIETTNFAGINNYTIQRYTIMYIENPVYNQGYVDALHLNEEDTDGFIRIIVLGDAQYQKYTQSLGLNYDEVKDKAILLDNLKFGFYNVEKNKTYYKYYGVYDYNVGDTLSMHYEDSLDDILNIEIGYVTDNFPFAIDDTTVTLIISDEVYNECIGNYSDITVYYDADDANALQTNINNYLKDYTYDINNISENISIMKNIYTLIAIFLYGFITVITLIGITNIFNTLTTMISLRQREFATLKSIGMTKKEFNRMITLESIFLGLKSLVVGVPLGLIISYIIYYLMGYAEGLSYNPPIVAIMCSITVVLLLIYLIMKYSINKINRQNTIETIRKENI